MRRLLAVLSLLAAMILPPGEGSFSADDTRVPQSSCQATTGSIARDGTASWAPSCSGTFIGQTPTSFVDPSPTGQAMSKGAIDKELTTTAQVFINAVARPSRVGQNGLFIAFDSGNGAPSRSRLPNNTGLIVASRQHPFPDGSAAPPTWTMNANTLCAPGSKGSICNGFEQDYTNFDKPCAHVGDGCGIHVMNWHNFETSFPVAQDTYVSANTPWQSARVTVKGSLVTPTSGARFSNDTTTVYLGMPLPVTGTSTGVAPIGGARYRVNPGSYDSRTGSVTLLATPAQQGRNINSAWNPHAVADVFLLSGDTVSSDNDIHDNTSAFTALKFEGAHQVVLSTDNDTAPIFATMRAGQYFCFSGESQCLVYRDNALFFGGVLKSQLFIGQLKTPASASSPCVAGQFQDDANYHYVCVAQNRWKRVALTDF